MRKQQGKQRRRWSVGVAVLSMALAVGLEAGPAQVARADAAAGPPPITYGFNLSQNAPETWDPTTNTLVLDVSTPDLQADAGQPHTIRVVLPTGYFDHPERRYPVFYLLHNMAASTSIVGAIVPQAYSDMIIVLPDGGPRGWYTNWADQNTAAGAQNWENFHIDQVIPFIDANFRTVATKQGRAIGGISMGGFGAFHYTQDHPELFSHLASFSGGLDLTQTFGQLMIANGESNATQPFLPVGPPEPTVPVGSIFGAGPTLWSLPDSGWAKASPTDHMQNLAGQGVGIDLYTGGGAFLSTQYDQIFEWSIHGFNMNAANAMTAAGVPFTMHDYGNGPWGPNCTGGHNLDCAKQDLVDYLPRLEAAFAADGV